MSSWLRRKFLGWLLADEMREQRNNAADVDLELLKVQLRFWRNELKKLRRYEEEEKDVYRREHGNYVS